MKFAFAAIFAAVAAEEAAAVVKSDVSDVTLAGTTVSNTAGCLKAKYHTENNNGTKTWVWNYTLDTKSTLTSSSTNQYQCVYMGMETTTSGTHQTAAVCSQSVNNGASYTGTVETYEWTWRTGKYTYNQANSSKTTAAVGGSTAKLETSVWTQSAEPTGAKAEGNNYFTYSLGATRPMENANAPLTAGTAVTVYSSYYVWSTNTSTNSIRDFLFNDEGVSVTPLDAGASALAAATTLAAAAALAF